MNEIRRRIMEDSQSNNAIDAQLLVVAVKLPSGAIESIINTKDLPSKVNYYLTAYGENMRLINNPEIKIVGYMLL